MLNAITDYLLLYKQVTIPFIGSFKLVKQPAQLDFASRLILAPLTEIIYTADDVVHGHQLTYLSKTNISTTADTETRLQLLGQHLKNSLTEQAFEWKGIGYLQQQGEEVVFKSAFQNSLTPVVANKVIRDNVSHAVTVGDKEMQSHEASELLQTVVPSRSYLMLIVWLLIILALVFIGYHFYTKGFTPLSSGTQQRVGLLKVLSPLVS